KEKHPKEGHKPAPTEKGEGGKPGHQPKEGHKPAPTEKGENGKPAHQPKEGSKPAPAEKGETKPAQQPKDTTPAPATPGDFKLSDKLAGMSHPGKGEGYYQPLKKSLNEMLGRNPSEGETKAII